MKLRISNSRVIAIDMILTAFRELKGVPSSAVSCPIIDHLDLDDDPTLPSQENRREFFVGKVGLKDGSEYQAFCEVETWADGYKTATCTVCDPLIRVASKRIAFLSMSVTKDGSYFTTNFRYCG